MSASRSVKPRKKRSSVPAASSPPHTPSRQSSDVDYAVAEQLIEHSQRARHNSELGVQDATRGHFGSSDAHEHPNSAIGNESIKPFHNPRQGGPSSMASTSQGHLTHNGQYDLMSQIPTLGQKCRSVALERLCPSSICLGI